VSQTDPNSAIDSDESEEGRAVRWAEAGARKATPSPFAVAITSHNLAKKSTPNRLRKQEVRTGSLREEPVFLKFGMKGLPSDAEPSCHLTFIPPNRVQGIENRRLFHFIKRNPGDVALGLIRPPSVSESAVSLSINSRRRTTLSMTFMSSRTFPANHTEQPVHRPRREPFMFFRFFSASGARSAGQKDVLLRSGEEGRSGYH
jgi:hypothetical protein